MVLLRYGLNPHQVLTRVEPVVPDRWPLRVLHGRPSMINLLDAAEAWALVREAAAGCGRPAAASFKHVSPAGAALAGPVDAVAAVTFGVDAATVGPLTSAYVRARDADPRASYGDMIAVSEPVDGELVDLLCRLPSDGIVAPGYAPGTVAALAGKKSGRFVVLEVDPGVEPPAEEVREVAGLRVTQPRDDVVLTADLLAGADLPAAAVTDLLLGLVVVRHTQSNAVAYLRDGMALAVGAGQQSRIAGTRLAGAKADTWWLRRHPAIAGLAFPGEVRPSERVEIATRLAEGDLDERERGALRDRVEGEAPELTGAERAAWMAGLDGVAFVSDGAIPFRDNVDHAARHGVRHLAEPGGALRSADVERACREHGIVRVAGLPRLFRH